MSKREFIDRLESALNGKVSPSIVTENVNYYQDYINMEIRKGRREEEVLQMLGDPRLIAKTIIETNNKGGRSGYQEAGNGGSVYRETDYTGTAQDFGRTYKKFQMSGLLFIAIVVLVLFLIFSFIFSVLSFLAPIIIPLLVIMFSVKLFRDWLN